MTVEFRVLGDLEARVDGAAVDVGHLRQRTVLAALLVDANRPVSVDRLLDRVWGEHPPQRAIGTLRGYLSRLRRALAGTADVGISRRPGGYLLTVEPMAVDLHRFGRLVKEARAASDRTAALALYQQALGLWHGDAFATLDTPWLHGVREALDRQRFAAELERNDLALAGGRHASLVEELAERAGGRPLDERLAAQLMLALYRCGRQADALDHFERTRLRLADELGADPGPELQRLHRRILTADPELAAPVHAVSERDQRLVPRQLPAPPRSFTGRVSELADLTRSTDARSAVVISAIGGAGGMGKTWLALRWAYDNLHRYPDGQLYVNLRGFDPASEPVEPAEALRAFLDAIGVDPAAIPVDPHARASLFRSTIAGRRMLIVLDNARDSAQVTPLLPGTTACAVLVTSRRQLAGLVAAHGARPVSLDPLPDRDGSKLLIDHLGAERVAAEPQAVAALIRWCAGLPLALGIIAARAAMDSGLPLSSLAGELQEASTRLDAFDVGELAVNLRAALDCSQRALSDEAALACGLLGLAPGPDISLPAAAGLTGLPMARARMLLRELVAAHLVQEHLPGRYRMHDLVRLYAGEQSRILHPDADRRAAVRRVLDHLLHTAHAAARLLYSHRDPISLAPSCPGVVAEAHDGPGAALDWLSAEHQVLLAAVELAAEAGFDRHTWQLAWTLANFLDRSGRWQDWVATQNSALAAAKRLADLAGQAQSHRRLVRAHTQLGRFDEARAHARSALELDRASGDHSGQAHTHLNVAWLADRQGRHPEALEHTRQALDLYRAAGNRAGQANALNGVGWCHSRLGDHRQALSCCEQALALHRELGNRHGEASTWESLGYAHHQLARYRRATRCYQHALDLYGALGNLYEQANMLNQLGDSRHAAGETEPARRTWRRALDILDDLGHADAREVRAKLCRLDRSSVGAA